MKIEIRTGSIEKLRVRHELNGEGMLSKKQYLQIRFRVTNEKPDFVLDSTPWGLDYDLEILDEFDKVYKQYDNQEGVMVEKSKTDKSPLKPGESIDGLLAFELPANTSNEFRLMLGGVSIGRPRATLGFKMERSFFEKKQRASPSQIVQRLFTQFGRRRRRQGVTSLPCVCTSPPFTSKPDHFSLDPYLASAKIVFKAPASAKEIKLFQGLQKEKKLGDPYGQREALLFALREVTGVAHRSRIEGWLPLLNPIEKKSEPK